MSSRQQTSASRASRGAAGPDDAAGRNVFTAIGLFVRQVIAELRKVVIPTRRELVGYTVTVLAFVFVMIAIVFGLDIAFGALAEYAFTTGGSAA